MSLSRPARTLTVVSSDWEATLGRARVVRRPCWVVEPNGMNTRVDNESVTLAQLGKQMRFVSLDAESGSN